MVKPDTSFSDISWYFNIVTPSLGFGLKIHLYIFFFSSATLLHSHVQTSTAIKGHLNISVMLEDTQSEDKRHLLFNWCLWSKLNLKEKHTWAEMLKILRLKKKKKKKKTSEAPNWFFMSGRTTKMTSVWFHIRHQFWGNFMWSNQINPALRWSESKDATPPLLDTHTPCNHHIFTACIWRSNARCTHTVCCTQPDVPQCLIFMSSCSTALFNTSQVPLTTPRRTQNNGCRSKSCL